MSLVPSLTEAIAATAPDRLVGATQWCTHPAGLDVARVRGTKNPDRTAIAALAPDLVVANKEENRELDVDRLRAAGIPVWVTVVESLDDAFASLRRLCTEALGVPAPSWLAAAEQEWAGQEGTGAAAGPRRRVVVPVWRDPWLVVGARTFTGDLLARLGLDNLVGDGAAPGEDRYPRTELGELRALAPDLVLLPDEPYRFTADDGPEAFPGLRTALVPGRLLTWYGPSLVGARAELERAVTGAVR